MESGSFELTPKFAIFELEIPEEWEGHTVMELEVRRKYNVNILGVKSGDVVVPLVDPNYRFRDDVHIIVAGDKEAGIRLPQEFNLPLLVRPGHHEPGPQLLQGRRGLQRALEVRRTGGQHVRCHGGDKGAGRRERPALCAGEDFDWLRGRTEHEILFTNIKASIKSTPPWLREDWSTEAKPAVRAVTD